MIGHVLVHLVSHGSVHLAGESPVNHPICSFGARNAFQSGVGGVKGGGVVERVVDTLLNLQRRMRNIDMVLNRVIYETTVTGSDLNVEAQRPR